MPAVRTGLEMLLENSHPWIRGKRIGLLCNPASVDRRFRHARERIASQFPGQLTALLAPQHGFFAEKQDNMIESTDMFDPVLKIPVFSLYGDSRRPTAKMLDPVDVLLIDLQDAGTRVYTFIYTMSYCLEAAKSFGKKVIVLDRPNPVNGRDIEGNCLDPAYASFVGRYPIPMRHGLTVGELARLFNDHFGIGCDLDVVRMDGWQRSMAFGDTGLPWVLPSPNLPTPAAALVYPGQVLWEGTNVSEGRGTALPFEIFGAPFIEPDRMDALTGRFRDMGAVLRPVCFEPTSNKWAGKLCRGFQIHVIDPKRFRPYRSSLLLLQAVLKHHRSRFEWKRPPYEYEYEKMPIDLILGDGALRRRIEALEDIDVIETGWRDGLEDFRQTACRFHLY